MKRLLSLVAFFATLHASAQQVNPVPDYVFRNQMSVGRGTVTDTAAYFSIGPRYGATKGFMPPIVGDTATFSSGKRNGLLIFSVQKNKFLYWDSVRVQWSDMAGSSGTYITGSGILGYVPQFSGTTTIDTSALFTIGNRLGIGTTSFAYNTTSTANVELNGTAGGIVGFKRNDSARGYLWHTGSDMELANTTAGTLSFNTNSSTRGSISSAGVWRLHNLAGTGDRVVVASSNGTLSASTSVTGLVDTLTLSTRAWRQKGDDSLGAIIATKGTGTVTSVATGFGLSGGTITTTGTLLVDTLNIATRAWRQKGLDSLAALEVSGSGTTNYVPKFTASSTIGNSQIFDNGTNVGIGTASPGAKLQIEGPSGAGGSILFQTSRASGFGSTELFQYYVTGGADYGSNFGINVSNATNGRASIIFKGDAVASNGTLIFNTNNTERLRITSGGNVGVGTTNPLQKFVVSNGGVEGIEIVPGALTGQSQIRALNRSTSGYDELVMRAGIYNFQIGTTNAAYIFANGRIGVNTTTDAGYQFDINGTLRSVNGANFATTSGNVGIGTASPLSKLQVSGETVITNGIPTSTANGLHFFFDTNVSYITSEQPGTTFRELRIQGSPLIFQTAGTERGRINSAGEWIIDASGTDAGDYKLQVVGNARVGTGKLDIASNTTFGLGIARSGTSEIAGQIYNSNGILYFGAESSAGGQIFTGSSAYAAVIGSGANYPLQFATNNATRATINTNGELLIGSTTDAGAYALQVTGAMYTTSTITTASPTADPVRPWKLGSVQAGTVALDTANYVEVEINGTYYRLAIVTPL